MQLHPYGLALLAAPLGAAFAQPQTKLLSGPLTSYHANGKLMEEETCLRGERHGRCRYYRPNGTLVRQETYRCGEKLGPTVYYNTQGQSTKTEVYWNQYVYEVK